MVNSRWNEHYTWNNVVETKLNERWENNEYLYFNKRERARKKNSGKYENSYEEEEEGSRRWKKRK